MRKTLAAILLVVIAIVCALYVYSKAALAYPIATNAMMEDPVVFDEFGKQRYSVLVGMQSKTSPTSGCASHIYYLFGSKANGFVNVRLQRKDLNHWTVIEISTGFYTPFKQRCNPYP